MAKIGYARVSTDKQDTAMQYRALRQHGCERIYEDIISGTATSREMMDKCIASLKPGDTLVVWKLDRLGRRASRLHNLIEKLSDQRIGFHSLTENLDTSTPMGKAMFGLMAVFAQLERDTIAERTRAALAELKASGRKLGKPYSYTEDQVKRILKLDSEGLSQVYIANHVGLSQPTVGRILKRFAVHD